MPMRIYAMIPALVFGCGTDGGDVSQQNLTAPAASADDTPANRRLPTDNDHSTDEDWSDVQFVAERYRQLEAITPLPVSVSVVAATRCSAITADELVLSESRYGPHAEMFVSIYMNTIAADHSLSSKASFPVGSVIVKEKSVLWPTGKTRPDGVGGMIKREPGFDATHGDWEYFYYEELGEIERGSITSCVQCHVHAKSTDYVFGYWAGQED